MERVSTCLLQVIVTETNGTETEMLAIMLPVRSWVFINSLQLVMNVVVINVVILNFVVVVIKNINLFI